MSQGQISQFKSVSSEFHLLETHLPVPGSTTPSLCEGEGGLGALCRFSGAAVSYIGGMESPL